MAHLMKGEAPFEGAEDDSLRRETALQAVSFVAGGLTLRLLADPTNAWGRSGGHLQHCNTGSPNSYSGP